MTRCASLGMYDHPAQRWANDALWAAIADELRRRGVIEVPGTLDRSRDVHSIWRDPGLILGQACGYPMATDHSLSLRIVALPTYDALGCTTGTHRSLLVVRRDDAAATLTDLCGRRAAINDPASNTGMNLFRAAIAPVAGGRSFFAAVDCTGSHRDSALAVATGGADIAAIDAVTFAALDRYEPDITRRLRVLGATPPSPSLPLVTTATTDDATLDILRRALMAALAKPSLADARAALFLAGATIPADDALTLLTTLAHDAAELGYPLLC